MKQLVLAGATSRRELIFINDSAVATGAGKTGLAFNTASLTAYYVRPGASPVAITLATQTVTGAYSSGGFVEVDSANMPGVYRFDPPNACFAAGVDKVVIMLKGAAGMAPVLLEYQIVAFNPDDAVRLGLTALPNAAAAAAGGLVTSAGANVLPNNAIDAASIATGAITAAKFAAGAIDAAAIATGAFDADALAADAVAEIADGVLDEPLSGHTAAGSLGQRLQAIRSFTAQAGAAGSITLDAGASAVDGFYVNDAVLLTAGTGALQIRTITGYNGTTKVATVSPNWSVNPDATTGGVILPATAADVTGTVDANVTEWNGVAVVTPAVAGVPKVDLTHYAGSAVTAPITGSVTPDAGNSATAFETDLASSATDFYREMFLRFTSGALAGQIRKITGYNGTTKFVTVSIAYSGIPADGVTFELVNGA